MSNVSRKKSAGFYAGAAAAIFELIGLITFAIMGADGEGLAGAVWATAIIGIVLKICSLFCVATKGDNRLLDIVGIVIAVLYALSFILMIQQRIGVITNIFASHTGSIGAPFILTTVFFFLACLVQIVEGFLNKEKISCVE